MKLPRWLVISMQASSVLAVLAAAAGWWWVTWPQRTAEKFCDLMKCHQWQEAQAMLMLPVAERDKDLVIILLHPYPDNWRCDPIEPQPRSKLDVIVGRQRYLSGDTLEFIAVRNRVVVDVDSPFYSTPR